MFIVSIFLILSGFLFSLKMNLLDLLSNVSPTDKAGVA